MSLPLLENDLMRLRALEPSDIPLLYAWENDTTQWEEGAAVAPFSVKLLSDYIDSYRADIYVDGQLRLMIELKDGRRPAGLVDLYEFDPVNRRAGVAVMVDAALRGKGYATSAISLLADYCRRRIEMHQLWAVVARGNAASLALFERCGFAACGSLRSWLRRDGRWADALMLQRLLNPSGAGR